jgi:hypothetical protein
MANKRKQTQLEWALEELAWLEAASKDDTVSEEAWRMRGNKLLSEASKLSGRRADKFYQAWREYQHRDTGIWLPEVRGEVDSKAQKEAEQQASREITKILKEEGLL